jgi:hypothetical protein
VLKFVKTSTLALALASLAAGPALAQTEPDRVTVGGKPATKAFTKALAISLTAPAEYQRGCCYTSVSGQWAGPRYRPSKNPNVESQAKLDWGVTFTRSSSSLAALAASGGFAGFPQSAQGTVSIPHLVGGRKAGTLKGAYVIDAESSPGARQELTLAIDISRRAKALVDLFASDPAADDSGEAGLLFVNGQPASQWNRNAMLSALKLVKLEGSLPPAKIAPKVKGRKVAGKVVDAFGHPDGEIPVVIQARKGSRWSTVAKKSTSKRGTFSLKAKKAGKHRIVASLAGTSVRKAVTVR